MNRIIITGASKGIGLAIATAVAPLFEELVLIASELSSFQDLPDTLKQKSKLLAADFNDAASCRELIKQLSALDNAAVLVNNAGSYITGKLMDTTPEQLDTQLNVNVRALFLLTQACVPLLEKGNHPQIINISSIAALKPSANTPAYSASKAAVSALSESLRGDLNTKGIRVSVIHPYNVNTWSDPHPEKLLSPEDIGGLVKYIISTDPGCQIEAVTVSALNK